MKNHLTQEIIEIFDIFQNNGAELFLVGGSVRDLLMGKRPSDFDFTTNLFPEETKELLKEAKIVDIGKKFGTLLIFYKGISLEITPYRKESEYDHRRPKKVSFGISLREDLERRDFTFNALAWNPKTGLLDYFQGKEDLEKKIIRAIGDPSQRFHEDALRMLRALRFAAQYDFSIEWKTFLAICHYHKDLKYISKERILEEFHKILISEHPHKGILLLKETGILKFIFPQSKVEFEHKLFPNKDLTLQLTLLLSSIHQDLSFSKQFLQDYPYSREIKKDILFLLENRELELNPQPYFLRKLLSSYGKSAILRLLQYRGYLGEDLELIQESLEKVLAENPPLQISDLVLDGRDLIEQGFPKGPKMGYVLKELLDVVLKDPKMNDREKLLGMIDQLPTGGYNEYR